jgi:hypothetical protein
MKNMTSELSRRDALKKIAAGGAAVAASVFWVDALASAAEQHAEHYHAAAAAATGPWTPKGLSADQNATVVALAEIIIPETETPGATKANVNRFVDYVLVNATADDRQKFLDSLAWLDGHVKETHASTFAKASPDIQLAVVTALSAQPAGTPGGEFCRAIKSLTVTGYYTSEIAMREEIGDDGNMFFAEFKGCDHPEHK